MIGFFSHTNSYILNVTQQWRCSPMLIFRAWATCDVSIGGTFYSLLGWSPPRTMTVFSFPKKLQTTLNISFFAVFLSSHATEPFISLLYLSLCTNCYCFFSVSRDAHYTFTLHSAIGFTTSQASCLQTLLWALL